MYCIGFNGPPRSGKDTVAREIDERYGLTAPTIVKSLSMPMRLVGFAMLGRPYNVEEYESIKDQPQEVFGGKTFRQFMIAFSEDFIKPKFGHATWGKSLISGLGTSIHLPGICLIPDIGFQAEVEVLLDAFGPDNFILVKLSRARSDWFGDSRGYCEAPHSIFLQNKLDDQARVVDIANSVLLKADNLGWEF